MAVIVLDPGHGGATKVGGSSPNNAVGPNGTLEKTLTLDVARRLRSVLQARGHQVKMTRDADNNLGLEDRAKVARTAGAPVFVSIHFNGSDGHNAQGTETFVHTTHRDISAKLCRKIQPSLVAATGLHDRNASHGGVKKQSLGVLRKDDHAATTACVLVEVSFLDRADEEQRLAKAAYKDSIVKALADGIDAYLGVQPAAAAVEAEEFGDAVEMSAAYVGGTVEGLFADMARSGDASLVAAAGASLDVETRLEEIAARIAAGGREGEPGSGNDANEFSEEPIGPGYDFSQLQDPAIAREMLMSSFGGTALATFDYDAFEAYIKSLGVDFFEPIEFLFLGSSNQSGACQGRNSLPPQSLWKNIGNTVLMLNAIRSKLGAPIRILSAYRSPAYNACIGGEPGSYHMKFNALDWTCPGKSTKTCRDVAKQVRGSDARFTGGVGYYPNRSFIHVDTRGSIVDWQG